MTPAYQKIIAATDDDQRGLFLSTANRIGTTAQNIEKDFWVCWTLEALFHHLRAGGPRLLFKGGTSLSKAFALISRFSEDIDITVFRSDLGETAEIEQLEALSKKKRGKRLDGIKAACQTFIADSLLAELNTLGKTTLEIVGKNPSLFNVTIDDADEDRQSLLIHYPSAVEKSEYVTPSVKIESGAKSALDPNEGRTIIPYLAPDIPHGDALTVTDVTTINPARTFLDKVLILHGMTFYFDAKNALRGNGRMSRHYYDIHQLMAAAVGKEGCVDDTLIEDCVRHAKMFFYRNNTGLDQAKRGSFRLSPTESMLDPLRRDYEAMAGMIFGEKPSFTDVLKSVAEVEERLNTLK